MVKIRPALPDDAEQICAVHRHSIETLGPTAYSQEVVTGWAMGLSPEGHRDAMLGREHMLVADMDGKILGFGSIIIEDNEIRAVYVDPDFIHQGIGSQLLHTLELRAQQAGLRSLKLASSLLAVEFYELHGYHRGEAFMHHLKRSGVNVQCVRMSKNFIV